MTPDPRVWLVWSREHRAWWRPNAAGYCTSVLDAGRYTLEEATDHCNTRSRDPQKDDPEVMVHMDEALKGLSEDNWLIDALRDARRYRVIRERATIALIDALVAPAHYTFVPKEELDEAVDAALAKKDQP